jgi:hypothetical protein
MMNVIKGAVNILIVCGTDSPSKFEENHPAMTKEMTEAWSTAFPQSIVHCTVQSMPVEPAVVI